MDPRQQALEYVKSLATSHTLTREELVAAYEAGAGTHTGAEAQTRYAQILYYIGGAIVFLGISIFVWQNWSTLSFPTKMLATMGGGIAAYVVALLFGRQEKFEGVSAAFYLISALVLPLGLYVVFENAGMDIGDSGVQTLIAGILFVVFIASFLLMRKTVLALFSILFGTILFYTTTNYLVGQNPYYDWWKFSEYRVLISGLAYLLLGYGLARGRYAGLSGFLYGFGILGFLGAALALGGWEPSQNMFWELLFPFLVFSALYVSVYLKSRVFLVFGALFLMVYILKITSEYFTSGLGWPLSLVVAGLLMIGVGYLSIALNKKYLRA